MQVNNDPNTAQRKNKTDKQERRTSSTLQLPSLYWYGGRVNSASARDIALLNQTFESTGVDLKVAHAYQLSHTLEQIAKTILMAAPLAILSRTATQPVDEICKSAHSQECSTVRPSHKLFLHSLQLQCSSRCGPRDHRRDSHHADSQPSVGQAQTRRTRVHMASPDSRNHHFCNRGQRVAKFEVLCTYFSSGNVTSDVLPQCPPICPAHLSSPIS